jgi:hypothetical protein
MADMFMPMKNVMNSIELLKKIFEDKLYIEDKKIDSDGNIISVIHKRNAPLIITDDVKNSNLYNFLPRQYFELMSYANGLELYNYDGIDGLCILGIDDVEKYTSYAKNTFEDDWDDNIFIIGKILGEDSYIGYRCSREIDQILDCYFEVSPEDWEIIDNGLDNFLTRFIVGKGKKFWIE